MNVKVNIQELLYMLDNTPAEQNIMLSGRHGIGKSEILTAYFADKGMKVIALFLGQMSDPGDLIGLPDKSGEITVFRPPYWFPIDGNAVKYGNVDEEARVLYVALSRAKKRIYITYAGRLSQFIKNHDKVLEHFYDMPEGQKQKMLKFEEIVVKNLSQSASYCDDWD